MKAYKALINKVLADGHTVSVWDGEEWQVKRSTSPKAIAEAIESVDEAQIRVRSVDGKVIGWALIIPYLDDGEDVADYTDNAYMNSFLS